MDEHDVDHHRARLRADQDEVEISRQALDIAMERRNAAIWDAADLGGLNHDQIAQVCGLTRSAVKKIFTNPRPGR